jgi:hypothetical protein
MPSNNNNNRADQNQIPWYRRKIKGARAQHMWQAVIAFDCLIAFVIIPVWIDYQGNKREKVLYANREKRWSDETQVQLPHIFIFDLH